MMLRYIDFEIEHFKILGLNRIWDSYVPWRTAAPPPWLPLHLLELNNKPSMASRVLRAQRPPRIARKQSFTSLFPQSLYLLESLTYENTNIDAHTKDQLIRKIIKNHKKKKITLELLLQPKSQGEFKCKQPPSCKGVIDKIRLEVAGLQQEMTGHTRDAIHMNLKGLCSKIWAKNVKIFWLEKQLSSFWPWASEEPVITIKQKSLAAKGGSWASIREQPLPVFMLAGRNPGEWATILLYSFRSDLCL